MEPYKQRRVGAGQLRFHWAFAAQHIELMAKDDVLGSQLLRRAKTVPKERQQKIDDVGHRPGSWRDSISRRESRR